jgi:hypothetical protein
MAAYKTLKGQSIKSISGNPANPLEGQIWYNSNSASLKGQVFVEAWASGGALPTATKSIRGCGIQTSALAFGGSTPPGPPYAVVETFEYNGSSWTGGGNLATNNQNVGAVGTQTAGLCFGGSNSDGSGVNPSFNTTQHYDGSSWTTVSGTMGTGVANMADGGVQTAAFSAGGIQNGPSPPPATYNVTEEYDGTNWTTGGSLPVANLALAGAGTLTAGLAFGGYVAPLSPAYTNVTNEYDGSSWTGGGNMTTGRDQLGGAGIQTSALAMFGGPNGPGVSTATEGYDGTSWAAKPNMATARKNAGGTGTNAAALAIGGYIPSPPVTAATEEFSKSVTTVTVTTS